MSKKRGMARRSILQGTAGALGLSGLAAAPAAQVPQSPPQPPAGRLQAAKEIIRIPSSRPCW